ncbi:aminopeptidase P family protein [Bacillus sp. RD4P76]|uniref:Aminopeptidase P family protein n=1 Tax=Bacillus suaedaesalsae TaxID=2810349 RepID=A0ABS2DHH1_9BACI|nr:aminopeptidase P family protein [Bacillus suaedaesalsae]
MQIQKEKINQAATYLSEQVIDSWLIVSRKGEDPSLPLLVGATLQHMSAFIFTKENNNVALCSVQDAPFIEKLGLFNTVHSYSNDFDYKLQEIISEIDPSTIAINSSIRENVADGITAGLFRKVQYALRGSFNGTYVKSEPFLTRLRAIKSKSEIKRIGRAIVVTEEIYEEVYKQLRVGMTEKEAGQLFVDEMKKRGVINGIDRTLSMPIVMKENIAHRAPSNAVIQEGDLVIFDFSVDVDGYVSDIARTVYFLREGEEAPPKEIQDAFNAVHEAITRAASLIKPGVKGFEVDGAARSYYVANGYPEISHATGHQIGRDVHDGGALLAAKWERYGDSPYQPLEEGMVFTIEPTLFLDNGIHFIVEENVVITESGFEYLSKRQNELILIK